jgi:hypothetical protein
LEQLNKIPDGFSNNLIWNIGHIIVSQQGLVYRLSGLSSYIEESLVETFKNGLKPTGSTTSEEVNKLKDLLISLIEKTKSDYHEGKFTSHHRIQYCDWF